MTSFPDGLPTKPVDIISGQYVQAEHVDPLWDEVIAVENVLLGGATLASSLSLKPTGPSYTPLTVRGVASQSAPIMSVGDVSDADKRVAVTSDGKLQIGSDRYLYRSAVGIETTNKLSLTTQGSGGGIVMGTDAVLYRGSGATLETTSSAFSSIRTNTTDSAFQTQVSGDSSNRVVVRADGRISFGAGGATGPDAYIEYAGSGSLGVTLGSGGTLAVTGNLSVTGSLQRNGVDVVATTDTRLYDSRTPQGAAGGDLTGYYPNPLLAAAGTAGTYTKVTTDTKGRVTSGSNPTTLDGYGITDSVKSVALSLPSIFSVSGSPIQSGATTGVSGTLSATLANQNINTVLAGPGSGASGPPTFRSLIAADLPSHTHPYDQITGLGTAAIKDVPATGNATSIQVVLGSDTRLTNSRTPTGPASGDLAGTYEGGPTLAAVGTAGTSYTAVTTDSKGRVTAGSYPTSVGYVTGPSGRLTFSSATSSTGPTGTTAISLDLASGVVTPDTYRSVTVDTYGRVTAGTKPTTLDGYAITDAIKSVALSLPSIFNVSGSPITSGATTGPTGSLSATLASQSINTVFAGPTGGSSAAPTFRSLVVDDLPAHTHTLSQITGIGTSASRNAPATGNATSTQVVLGSDTRLTDSRTPTGPAGGDLSGTYEGGPTLAAVGTAGTYTSVTTDSKGRVTSGTNPVLVTSVTGPSGQLTFSVTGPTGANAITVGLATTGSAGTYTSVTTDAYGRVTSGSNPTPSKATNVAGGLAGQIHYQSAADTTAFLATGPTGSVLTANGVAAPSYTAQSSLTAGKATAVAGGLAGQIPYQSAADTTAFLATGPAGAVLTSFGGATGPVWSTTISNANVVGPTETFATRAALTGPTAANFDAKTQSVLYANSNAGGNWTLNVRGNSTTTLDSMLSVGQSMTIVLMNQNGSPAYYQTAMTIDGTSVTPKWFTGTAPTSGNINSTDVYTFTIMKTAATPTYTVLASTAKFA